MLTEDGVPIVTMDHWTWWCNAWYHIGMFAWVDSWPAEGRT